MQCAGPGKQVHTFPHRHFCCANALAAALTCSDMPKTLSLPLLQGFLAPGTDVTPIVPALEKIWADSLGQSLADFNFRSVTSKFNDLVYQYPIRIPERYSLVIRWALCICPQPGPVVARGTCFFSRGCRDRLPSMPALSGIPTSTVIHQSPLAGIQAQQPTPPPLESRYCCLGPPPG